MIEFSQITFKMINAKSSDESMKLYKLMKLSSYFYKYQVLLCLGIPFYGYVQSHPFDL